MGSTTLLGRLRTNPRRLSGGEQGYALMAVIVASAMIFTVGIVGVRAARMELKISSNELQAQKALSVAEAGLAHAVALIEAGGVGFDDELGDSGTGGALVDVGITSSVNGDVYRFHAFGSGSEDGYYVRVVDNFDETAVADDPTADADNRIKLVSLGKIGHAQRIVQVVAFGVAGGGAPGFYARDEIVFSGTAWTDSFNSDLGPYGGSNVGDNGSIYSNGQARLTDDMTINGDLDAAELDGEPTVTGDTTIPAEPLDFPIPDACGPPYFTTCNGIAACAPLGITQHSGGADCKPEVKSNGNLGVQGDCDFAPANYCFNEAKADGGALMYFSGATTFELTAKASFTGGGFVNETGLAKNLQIISSMVTTGGSDGVKMTGGSDAYMQVYVPGATVEMTGGGDGNHYYGSIVSRVLKGSGTTSLHYDDALGGGTGLTLTLSHWREAREF